jgi:hypothetical protein
VVRNSLDIVTSMGRQCKELFAHWKKLLNLCKTCYSYDLLLFFSSLSILFECLMCVSHTMKNEATLKQ